MSELRITALSPGIKRQQTSSISGTMAPVQINNRTRMLHSTHSESIICTGIKEEICGPPACEEAKERRTALVSSGTEQERGSLSEQCAPWSAGQRKPEVFFYSGFNVSHSGCFSVLSACACGRHSLSWRGRLLTTEPPRVSFCILVEILLSTSQPAATLCHLHTCWRISPVCTAR